MAVPPFFAFLVLKTIMGSETRIVIEIVRRIMSITPTETTVSVGACPCLLFAGRTLNENELGKRSP